MPKKKELQKLTSKTGAEDISSARDRDFAGQLTNRSWSCLILDFADEVSKKLGKKARELHYRLAQMSEAWSTNFEGQSEQEIAAMILANYVVPSIQESTHYGESGPTWSMVILPYTLIWSLYDYRAQVFAKQYDSKVNANVWPIAMYYVQRATNLDFLYTRIATSHTFYYIGETLPSAWLWFNTFSLARKDQIWTRFRYAGYTTNVP